MEKSENDVTATKKEEDKKTKTGTIDMSTDPRLSFFLFESPLNLF